jgi:hypothetical protein
MKKLNYLIALIASILIVACDDPDLRFESFDQVDKGAFARNLSLEGDFELADPVGSSIDAKVEFYDENDGKTVSSYNWTVEYRPASGSGNTSAVAFLAIDESQFVLNEDGLPEVGFSLNMNDAIAALGLDINDVLIGDEFRFEATITQKDGSSFTSSNSGGNLISQPPFASLFRISAMVE